MAPKKKSLPSAELSRALKELESYRYSLGKSKIIFDGARNETDRLRGLGIDTMIIDELESIPTTTSKRPMVPPEKPAIGDKWIDRDLARKTDTIKVWTGDAWTSTVVDETSTFTPEQIVMIEQAMEAKAGSTLSDKPEGPSGDW